MIDVNCVLPLLTIGLFTLIIILIMTADRYL